jgi:hypothetical protein
MLQELTKIPHPSIVDLIISAQLVIWGLLIKEAMHLSYAEEQKLRKQHISHHIKHHSGRFVRCGACPIETGLVIQSQKDLNPLAVPEPMQDPSVTAVDQAQFVYSDNLKRE